MKPVLTRILRPVVKTLYRLVINIRRFIRKYIKPYRKRRAMSQPLSQNFPSAKVSPTRITTASVTKKTVMVDSPRQSGILGKVKAFFSRKKWWTSRPFIAGAGVLVAIVAVVLIFTLPRPVSGTGASASSGGSYAALVDAVDIPSATPVAAETPVNPSSTPIEPSPTEEPSATPVPTTKPEEPKLVPGVHDKRIIKIQTRLMDLGYMDNDEPTDYYGGGTKFALQLFQRKHSLQVDGLLGEKTTAALFADDAQPYTVKLGDKGTDVKEIQERLKDLKYFSGTSNGEFGEKTETAVKNFQKRNGLTADGNIGEHTRDILFSDEAKEAKTSSSNSKDSNNSSKSGSSSKGGSSSKSGSNSSGGGSSSKTGPAATDNPDAGKADTLIAFAQTLLGKEYTRGGKGPNEFDCSGFVYYCLNHSGVKNIKYMTSAGWKKCSLPRIDKIGDLKRGDIICFKGHVAIYMGGGKMIHASSSADKVVIGNATSSWSKRNFICGRRVL